eukprot:2367836-Rhodomonas_salina.1
MRWGRVTSTTTTSRNCTSSSLVVVPGYPARNCFIPPSPEDPGYPGTRYPDSEVQFRESFRARFLFIVIFLSA